MRFLIGSCLALALTAGARPAAAQFKQIGYMPSWQGSVSSVQWQYLTHVNYAFALPNSNGSLQPIENTAKLSSLVSTAHSHNVKVLLSIGGWNDGNDSAFESLAGNSTARTNFVNASVNVMNQYGLDGIDIDWEYPDSGASATNYQNLMNQLCSAMHSRGKLCTAAVVAQGSQGSGVNSAVFGYVDYLQIMAYDANNANHSTYAYAESSLNYWLNRGLPPAKAVLGVPFYARPSWAAYSALLAAGCSSTANSCTYQGAANYYNGTTLIGQKRTLALNLGGGIMNWELSQDVNDSRSLLRAMAGGGAVATPTNAPRPTATATTARATATSARPTPTTGGGTFSGNYKIIARHSGKAVVVKSASTADGAAVIQYTYSSTGPNDEWTFTSIGSGYYKIINRNSGKAMNVTGASTADGAKVIQWTYDAAALNADWSVTSAGGTYYRLTNRKSGKVLDVTGNSTANDALIQQWTWGGGTNQQFEIIAVP
jgi:chitinase